MKKLLLLLGASALTPTLTTTVAISCSTGIKKQEKIHLVDVFKETKLN